MGRKKSKYILQDGAREDEEVLGAFKQRKRVLKPDDNEQIHLADGVRIPAVGEVRGGVPPTDIQVEAIPPGPYKTEQDKWKAIIKLQDVNIRRRRAGFKFLNEKQVRHRMQLSANEIEKEVQSEGYKKLRLSKAASNIQQSIADIEPVVRRTIQDVSSQMENMPPCAVCGRNSAMDLEKKREYLEFVVSVMDKFGLKGIDTSYAEQNEEMDTEEAIAEAVKIIEEAKTWPNLAPQRVVAALVTRRGGTDTRTKKQKTSETHKDSGASKGDATDRPDEAVHPVRVPETNPVQQEEVYSSHHLEPRGEDEYRGGGPSDVRAGETPNSENPEERGHLDIGEQERQGASGVAPEVQGSTGAERI